MTTGNFENWAGDISQIGPIYPFVGTEFLLFILGVVFWIGWHLLQMSAEKREWEEDESIIRNKEKVREFIESS